MTRILIATNEPWGTYHLTPLLHAAAAAGVELVHVVPDLHQAVTVPDGPLQVAALDDLLGDPTDPAASADLLVVTGATRWPGEVAAAFPRLPVAASCLAYMHPEPGEAAEALRGRIIAVSAASTGDTEAFLAHLDLDPAAVTPAIVGSPLLDGLTEAPDCAPTARRTHSRCTHSRRVLVLTSVTYSDATGNAAPGTDLLQRTATELAERGAQVRVRLHPRESPVLWNRFETCPHPLLLDSLARADLAVMIPGTAAPLAVAAGVPVAAVAASGLAVPAHIARVCGTWLTTDEEMQDWLASGARTSLPSSQARDAAVGPVGGAAHRLIDLWATTASVR